MPARLLTFLVAVAALHGAGASVPGIGFAVFK